MFGAVFLPVSEFMLSLRVACAQTHSVSDLHVLVRLDWRGKRSLDGTYSCFRSLFGSSVPALPIGSQVGIPLLT